MGCALVPTTIVAVQGLPNKLSGLGSGLLNTARLMGGAVGLAVLSTIATAETNSHHGSGAVKLAGALTDGFDLAFAVAAAMCVAGALVALARLGVARGGAAAKEPVPAAAEDSLPGVGEPAETVPA